jgi:hypothetical protein
MFDDPRMVALGLGRYAFCFPWCNNTRRVLAMDSTPNYLLEPSASANMWRLYPSSLRSQMRFLVILRDPTVRFKAILATLSRGRRWAWT